MTTNDQSAQPAQPDEQGPDRLAAHSPQPHDPYAVGWQAYDPHGYATPGYPYAAPPIGYGHGSASAPLVGPTRPRARRTIVGAGAALVAAALVASGVAIGAATSGDNVAGSGSLAPATDGGGSGGSAQTPSGGQFPNTGLGGGTTSAALATATQKKGVVTVVSVLKYQNAESAGTGMILTSTGEVLTNNHVIDGATSVTVTVASTGKSYRASVVGTDPSDDVAVLQLRGASGLQTAKVGDSSDVSTGDSIVGVGNAGGTGTLRAASGKVTGVNQTITATDEQGQNAENLTGLIGVNANIISGDSGGPMYDSDGEIIGMNTAAAATSDSLGGGMRVDGSGSAGSTSGTSAYAIPIDKALSIADQIESGAQTSTIHIGLPGFIGVSAADANGSGAAITSLLDGGPADEAGIAEGSIITSVAGQRVTSARTLKSALAGHKPGASVRIAWTDASGSSHSATVRLATGPAD